MRAAVAGVVLTPADPGCADEMRPWNRAVQHSPDVVVGATRVDDVVAAVRWAADHDLPIAVQTTGHGAADPVTGGVLVTTGRMTDVEVDPGARTARIGAGASWRDVLTRTVPHGLIGLNGSSTDVGAVGYLVGGGLPVLGRAYGFGSDQVRAFEVVTPDGELRTADAQNDPDLFTALRGGRGNVGIVTAAEINLLPVDEFYGGGIMYPGDEAETVLSAFRRWAPTLPDEAATSFALLRLPDLEFVPGPLRGKFLVHVRFAFVGPKEAGDSLIAPMRAVSTPVMDTVGPMSYLDVDRIHMDPPDPLPFEGGAALLADFDEAAQSALLSAAGPGVHTPLLLVEVRLLGGALARADVGPDAVTGRGAAYSLFVLGALVPPIAELVPRAIDSVLDAMRPHSTGYTFPNFHMRPGDTAAPTYEPRARDVIMKAKRRYDPAGRMRSGTPVGG